MRYVTLFLLCLIGGLLVGCTGESSSGDDPPAADLLPLSDEQPTFVFFYTNG